MTNINIIEIKISSIQENLNILREYEKHSQEEIQKDLTLKGAIERYLYLITQETIDLAEAMISFKSFRRPSTYSESFSILHEEKIISSDLTEKLIKMTGFRNIISHDYKNLDFSIIYDVLKNRLQDIEEFLSEIKKSLNL